MNKLFDQFSKYLPLSDYSKKLLIECCGERVIDLLMHFPSSILERTDNLEKCLRANSCKEEIDGRLPFFNAVVTVCDYEIPSNKAKPFKIVCSSDYGEFYINYFSWYLKTIKKLYPIGGKVSVSGRISKYKNSLQMAHPDKVGKLDFAKYWNEVEPIYPTIANLSSEFISMQIRKILKLVEDIDEWIPKLILEENGWGSFINSIYKIHHPKSYEDISIFSKPRERIAFDEILANQIGLINIREKIESITGSAFQKNEDLLNKVNLPFDLTDDQNTVLEDIYADLANQKPMNRLIQGDVGSGKTVVAFLSMLSVISGGGQVAFIAPTEVLATQHYEKIKEFAKCLHINIDLIIARNRKYRDSQIRCLKAGLTNIAIGTHALLEDNIEFQNLGLVVIDEQQRFGVMQRLKLIEKGNGVNSLYLSATPIPRTLVLSIFGDLDVSTIKTKPKYRQPIETAIVSQKRIDDVIERINVFEQQVYWICPLIEESEAKKMSNVSDRFEYLRRHIPSVGFLHGKMKSEEKQKVLYDFKDNKFKVLVSTTVIEVGIDVPNANIIVIENAENFGLSQLHQLRGRVGRGKDKSYCILLYGEKISKDGINRLSILKNTTDGFELSEADMRIRGYGNILGTEQSGFNSFKYCDLSQQQNLLEIANNIASTLTKNSDVLLDIYKKNENLILM